MSGHAALHGIGKKPRDNDLAAEAIDFESLDQGAIAKGQIVLEEVPVFTEGKTDVGAEGDETTDGLQNAGRLQQTVSQIFCGGKVFEKIAGEDDVDAGVVHSPLPGDVLGNDLN